MEGGSENGGFSSRATVEDIQRRLLRPSSLHSLPPTPSISSLFSRCSQSEANCRKREAKEEETAKEKKNKLDDYLDPVLLSAIASKIGRTNKVRKMMVTREAEDFEWPVDELRILMEDSAVGEEKHDRPVSLGNDSDNDLTGHDEVGDDKFCTPFGRFEQLEKLFGL